AQRPLRRPRPGRPRLPPLRRRPPPRLLRVPRSRLLPNLSNGWQSPRRPPALPAHPLALPPLKTSPSLELGSANGHERSDRRDLERFVVPEGVTPRPYASGVAELNPQQRDVRDELLLYGQ